MENQDTNLPDTNVQVTQDMGVYSQSDFIKKLDNTNELFLMKCPNCGGVHYRHAGYVVPMLPFTDPPKDAQSMPESKISASPVPVELCVKCKHSYILHNCKIYDVTKHVDLQAWEKTEKEAHKATGPGSQC